MRAYNHGREYLDMSVFHERNRSGMQEIYRVHLASPKYSEALRLGFAYHVTVVEFFFSSL